MSFNEKLPEWRNTGVEPPENLKNGGWEPGQKPPADYFNWLQNRTYKALEEIHDKAETKTGAQAKADAAEQAAKAYTDAEVGTRATKTEFNAHVSDNVRHITASERNSWNAKETPAGAQAKANAAEQAAIEWAQSFGLGSNGGISLSDIGNDLNNALQNGWYNVGSGALNAPDDLSWWTVLVSGRATERLAQLAFRTISNNRQVKIRFLTDSGWSDWGDIWTSFNLPNPETQTGAQTKANAARDAAIEWAKSFGLGTNSKFIGSQDLNNLTETGFYSGHLLVNGPSEAHTSGFVVHVEYRMSGFAFQIFAEVGSNERMYYRLKRDDVWNDWKRIWNSENLSSPAQTNVSNNFTQTQTFSNARTSSATPTGSGNGYFRNTYIHSANPSGGNNGDVWHQYS